MVCLPPSACALVGMKLLLNVGMIFSPIVYIVGNFFLPELCHEKICDYFSFYHFLFSN